MSSYSHKPTSPRDDSYDDNYLSGGTGGKFRPEPSTPEPEDKNDHFLSIDNNKLKEEFKKSVQEKYSSQKIIEENLKTLAPIIQKMQDAGMKVGLDIPDAETLRKYHIKTTKPNAWGILTVYDQAFAIILNAKGLISTLSSPLDQRSSNNGATDTQWIETHTTNPQELSEWAWRVFNTASEYATKEELKKYATPLPGKGSSPKKQVQPIDIRK